MEKTFPQICFKWIPSGWGQCCDQWWTTTPGCALKRIISSRFGVNIFFSWYCCPRVEGRSKSRGRGRSPFRGNSFGRGMEDEFFSFHQKAEQAQKDFSLPETRQVEPLMLGSHHQEWGYFQRSRSKSRPRLPKVFCFSLKTFFPIGIFLVTAGPYVHLLQGSLHWEFKENPM